MNWKIGLALTCIIPVLAGVDAFAQDVSVEDTTQLKVCQKVEAKLLVKGSKETCLAYDFTKKQGTFEINICGGWEISAGGEIGSFGIKADVDAQLCNTFKVTVKAESQKGAVQKLNDALSDPKDSSGLRKKMLEKAKEEIQKYDPEQLEQLHVDPEKMQKINDFKSLPVTDASSRPEVAKKIEKLPPPKGKPNG